MHGSPQTAMPLYRVRLNGSNSTIARRDAATGRFATGFTAAFFSQYRRPGRAMFSFRRTFANPKSDRLPGPCPVTGESRKENTPEHPNLRWGLCCFGTENRKVSTRRDLD